MNGQRQLKATPSPDRTARRRVFGTAVGADYRFSAYPPAGFALAGGGTSFGVPNGGGWSAPICSGAVRISGTSVVSPPSPPRSPIVAGALTISFSDHSQGS